MATVEKDKEISKLHTGIGSNGIPRLPPIARPEVKQDPYANSKLKHFRLAREQQELLTKIMYELPDYAHCMVVLICFIFVQ